MNVQMFIVLAACILPACMLVSDDTQLLNTAIKHCVQETGVNQRLLISLRAGKEVNDRKLHCFGACALKYLGVMNQDGSFNRDAAIARVPSRVPIDKATKIIDICFGKRENDDCDTAALLFRCLRENDGLALI